MERIEQYANKYFPLHVVFSFLYLQCITSASIVVNYGTCQCACTERYDDYVQVYLRWWRSSIATIGIL